MLTVHIKVIELLTQEKHTSMNPLNIFAVCSGALDTKLFKLKIVKGKDDNALKCQKSILYNLPTQNKNFLCLELKRHRVIVADDNLGKLTLPLSWFPTNHVVREWFPFKAASKKVKDAMILLDVHVDARKAAPFMAPFASLRVFPCWNRPTQTINSDFPISPPMVYVITSAEQRTIPLQQLRMMVSQQQINPAPPQILPNAQPLTQNYNPVIATQSQLNPNINLQQQQQPMQRTQSLVQRPTNNINQQRPQSQIIQPQHQAQIQQNQVQPPPQRPAPFPSYPTHSSSDDDLNKSDEEEQQTHDNQQNAYSYYPPSGQPYQGLYTPTVTPSNQYNAPTYQPPQGNPPNDTTYTPSIY